MTSFKSMNAAVVSPLPMKRLLFAAALIAAFINFYAFYPGLYHHDAWAYVAAIRTGEWTNWQPPLLGCDVDSAAMVLVRAAADVRDLSSRATGPASC